jgi:hypothetical protein
MIIEDEKRLRELLEEVAEWPLQKRRDYLEAMQKWFGPEAAQQIKDGLTKLWQERKR